MTHHSSCKFKMYLEYVPMLTKGALAIFFGGHKIALNPNVKSNERGSPFNPAFFTVSMLLQGTFYFYKQYKSRRISGNKYSTRNLQCLVLAGNQLGIDKQNLTLMSFTGLGNMYSMFVMITFTSVAAIGVLFVRYFVNENTRRVFI